MGAGPSKPSARTIRVLNSAEAEERLKQANESDGYFYACMACAANRAAMQSVEPIGAPAGAEERLRRIVLPAWIPNELDVAFFREGLAHTRGDSREAMHTRGSTVWLPYDALGKADFERTFLHECIHISQRADSERWTKLYETAWNMRVRTAPLPAQLAGRLRLNPDTFGWPHFTWSRWTPVLTFMRPDAPRLQETRLLFVNDGSDVEGWQSATPGPWMKEFGIDNPSVCEHPNEMSAYLLSDASLDCKARQKLLEAISSWA